MDTTGMPLLRRVRQRMALWVFLLLVCTVVHAASGARISARVDLPPSELKPGEFIWAPDAAPAGPLVMVISIDEQLAYIYRNGLRIGVSTVSTGKKGKETPTGVFTILEKQKDHRSSLYDDAPMPFMQRLTWGGVALHAGNLPGYPASHGCVRLPYEFARQLYAVTTYGMTVVVAATAAQNAELAHPSLFAPIVVAGKDTTLDVPRMPQTQAYQWMPEKSPTGPLTILVSTSDRLVLAIRNGIEIGRARIDVSGDSPFTTEAYVMLAGNTGEASPVVPGKPGLNWQSIPLPGYSAKPGAPLDSEAIHRVKVPPSFASLVYDQMVPGTTLVLTDAPILPRTTGEAMTIVTAEDEQPESTPQKSDASGH